MDLRTQEEIPGWAAALLCSNPTIMSPINWRAPLGNQTRSDKFDVDIEERIYPIAGTGGNYDTTAAEWEEIQKHNELVHNIVVVAAKW